MIRPDYLKQGDKVAIVCTARKFSREEAKLAIELMNSWGLEVVLGDTIGLDNYQLGGTDEERANDFTKQLKDPDIKAIWCARGGYGTVRIIDEIDFTGFVDNPKWIIGFSDVTVLHSHVHNLGVETIHGIMAFSVEKSLVESRDSLYRALFGQELSYQIKGVEENRCGKANGVLVGGNLSILYSLLGSQSSMDTKGKILFIEDLDEYLYHIDRMMHNLKRNGLLNDLAGIIVGGMTDMHDNAIPFGYDAKQIILSITKEFDYPIVFDFPSGHGVSNLALNLGREVELEVLPNVVSLKFK
ncbi:muramoyltetrapeptide carboxypeptidase [Myroides marinus]|uniref:LD-carboxypeptidase n=1 Tax=Myroides marinus TaxID=703342 RepID=A0A161UA45_9FLAO|nr:LD-carboxypeptidase [Myroides marinus]KUF45280.1 LD-carboxypeptidase [Myroides marinus]KZE82926.1 LD-carboxypeptidase [Myroides marinus]SEI53505.1 muramoyltetrapeptide carboxypeptidase [Myroides marinus]